MRASELFFQTLREAPADAETASYRLLLRGGFICRKEHGLYSFPPLGARVIDRLASGLADAVEAAGIQFVIVPSPTETPGLTWSGAVRDLADLVAGDLRSYRQLPIHVYMSRPINRGDSRPRLGPMSARQFNCLSGCSFLADDDAAETSADEIAGTIVDLCSGWGLDLAEVAAESETGLSEADSALVSRIGSGDRIFLECPDCGYAAYSEVASPMPEPVGVDEEMRAVEEVHTPDMKTVRQVTEFLGVPASRLAKTMIYLVDGKPVAGLVRGDRELDEGRLLRAAGGSKIELAGPDVVAEVSGAPVGFAGPVGIEGVRLIVDPEVAESRNIVTGANKGDFHLVNVNPGRDFSPDLVADLRRVQAGDTCPQCQGSFNERRGIEVGRTTIIRSGALGSGLAFRDKGGHERAPGVMAWRIDLAASLAAIVEAHHDANGIIWPARAAPFQTHIIVLEPSNPVNRELGDSVDDGLRAAGLDVLLDDRDERAGVKFKDADLLGIPVHVVVGKLAPEGKVEVRSRVTGERWEVSAEEALSCVREILESPGPVSG